MTRHLLTAAAVAAVAAVAVTGCENKPNTGGPGAATNTGSHATGANSAATHTSRRVDVNTTDGGAAVNVDTTRNANPAPANRGNANDRSNTFTLKGPGLFTSTSLKQGEKKVFEMTVDRGDTFKQAVQLSAETPKGVTAKFDKPTVAAGDAEKVNLTVEVAPDAAVGDHVIRVTGKPESGPSATEQVKLSVSAK